MGLAVADVRGEEVVPVPPSNFSSCAGRDCEENDTVITTAAHDINQDLLLGLRSLLQFDTGADQHFPACLDLKSYDDFFDYTVPCPSDLLHTTQARFNALRKHGNCRTRKAVIVRPERYDLTCDLAANEWETLLKPLLHNPYLEELYILPCTSIDSHEVKEKIYSILGEVLRINKTLKFMFLEMGGLSAANVARLARGLQGNVDSNLEALIIIDRPQLGTMSFLWDMIQSAPKLRHLWLKRIGPLDDAAVLDWSEALRHSASLVKLTLEGLDIEGVSRLLTKGFTEAVTGPNQSVRELELIKIDDAPDGWDQFFKFLWPNTTFTCLQFRYCKFLNTDEGFRSLLGLLQINVTLRKLVYDSISSWKKDGKEAAIQNLLERNAKLTEESSMT